MSSTRTLTIIGASEETVAHIRLLLRIAGPRLQHRWELRDGDDADLLLIEPGGDLGISAIQTRCEATGVPYAVLCDHDELIVHGMALRRPLKLDQLVAILNAGGAMRPDTEIVAGLQADFYSAELGDEIPVGSAASTWDNAQHAVADGATPRLSRSDSDAIDAFDLLVHGDPLAEPVPDAPLLSASSHLEQRTGGETSRSNLQRDAGTRAASLMGVTPVDVSPIALETVAPNSRTSYNMTEEDDGAPALPGLLREGVLHSPVRVHANGLPDVVLDPKTRRFFCAHPLQDLLPYASASIAVVQRSGIVGAELQRIRDRQIARPFDELRWLFALAASHGRLDSALDPGGSYAIRDPFAAAAELRAHANITAAMAQPTPLHEVTRASGARMEEVFDIVNAYAAIDRIEYIPRQSLQASSPKDARKGLWGLFSRK